MKNLTVLNYAEKAERLQRMVHAAEYSIESFNKRCDKWQIAVLVVCGMILVLTTVLVYGIENGLIK